VKTLAWALPWLLVAVAAAIFAFTYPAYDPNPKDAAPLWRYELVKALLAMLIGGLLVRFGTAIGEGMQEGLRQQTPKK
jgi:hypothetical protein